MHTANKSFYKAPRYVLRKHNILDTLGKYKKDLDSFLDVGCGAGELACTLAKQGLKGEAVDFSDEAIEHAKTIRAKRGVTPQQLKFHVGGLEKVKGKKFDLVICSEVLEHIEDDAAMLRELLKHTRKYLLVSVPAKQKLFDSSDKAVGHFRRYEKESLQKMLESEGLSVLHFVNYGYPFTNLVRVLRKASFAKKLKKDADDSMEDRSKESGINPVKIPAWLHKIDIEEAFKPLYHVSRPFNGTDLGEGYLAFCEIAE